MIQLKNILNNLISIFFSALFGFSLTYALTSSLMFKYNPLLLFIVVFFTTCLYSVIFYNKKTLIVSGISLGAALIIFVAYSLFYATFIKSLLSVSSFFTWVLDYCSGFEKINLAYQQILTLILVAFVVLLTYLFTLKKFKFFILLAGGISIFIIQWIYNIFVSYFAFYLYILLIIIYYFKYIHSKYSNKEPNSYINPSMFSVWMIPLSIIIVLICGLIPYSPKPLQVPWLDKKVNAIYNYFNQAYKNYKSSEFFFIESTGFGENSKLGGKVKLDKTLVMKVKSPNVVYLRGGSREVYTGDSWENLNKEKFSISSNNLIESDEIYELNTAPKLLTRDLDFSRKYYKDTSINVTYQNLINKTIFAPSKTYNVKIAKNDSYKLFSDQNNILTSKNLNKKNFEYSSKFYYPDSNNKEFQQLLRQSKVGLYDEIINKVNLLNQYIKNSTSENIKSSSEGSVIISYTYNLTFNELSMLLKNSNGNLINSDFINYCIDSRFLDISRQGIYPEITFGSVNLVDYNDLQRLSKIAEKARANYLQLPENLPSRVKNLAASITAPYTNDYDKVKAIERYLSKNYLYTLDTESIPKNRDFVDYFLFESKEGYCTYYATSMAILVRSLGIPSRYVEGFVLPPRPSSNGLYEVTNQQAHAWVEVYFEGFGWLPFEPTAPFVSAFYNEKQSTAGFSSSFPNSSGYNQYMRMMKQYGNPNDNSANEDIPEPEKKNYLPLYIVLGVLALLILIFAFVTLTNMAKNKYTLYKNKKIEPRTSVIRMYLLYIKLLSEIGYPMRPGETPLQYSTRIDSYVIFDKKSNFSLVTNIFLSARYSKKNITSEDKLAVIDFYENIINEARSKLGKLKFFVKRYLLGKI